MTFADLGPIITVVVAVLGLVAAGVLAARHGRTAAQEQATDAYKEAAEAWESRYRAQEKQILEQERRIDGLNKKIEEMDKDRDRLRDEIADLRSRPDYDALVTTVHELATAVSDSTRLLEVAVANENRLREHAHNLANLGGAINLKLDALLRERGIDTPTEADSDR